MTNENLLLLENNSPFSPIAVLHYAFYRDRSVLAGGTLDQENLQCVVGRDFLPFGKSQQPGLRDYADGEDTMQFLRGL